jgi:hypothetical protein
VISQRHPVAASALSPTRYAPSSFLLLRATKAKLSGTAIPVRTFGATLPKYQTRRIVAVFWTSRYLNPIASPAEISRQRLEVGATMDLQLSQACEGVRQMRERVVIYPTKSSCMSASPERIGQFQGHEP